MTTLLSRLFPRPKTAMEASGEKLKPYPTHDRVAAMMLATETTREDARELLAREDAQQLPAAWMAHDRVRAITEEELQSIPNDGGRRDRCRALYRIPLYERSEDAPAPLDPLAHEQTR